MSFTKPGWNSTGPKRRRGQEGNKMSNLLFQTIDQISREKGIDPQIVVHAIEDAIVVASRKYFKSNEELRGRINPDTGEIDVYGRRQVVEEVTNPRSEERRVGKE